MLRSGLALSAALGVAFAAETLSITVMEMVDNAAMLAVPGAMEAGLTDPLFWGALALGLGLAWVAAFPLNRWLLGHGLGHARAMAHRGGHAGE